MSKNESETLKQRRKAQKELIELKKMQQGQLDPALLNDDDKKIVPKTLDEKCENFWFYNRYKLLATAFAAIVLTILIVSCATRTQYDAKAVFYCYEYVDPTVSEATGEWLEKYYTDVNENGKVEILCTDCSFSEDTDLAETVSQQQMKIQTMLMDAEALLFILDDQSLAYLNSISERFTVFEEENIVPLGESFYAALPDDRLSLKDEEKTRYLCLRSVDESVVQGDVESGLEAAKAVLEKVKNEASAN